jgi:hypothetical protein
MATLRVSYSDRRNGARASVAVEVDLDALTVADPKRLAQLIREQQTYVRIAVLDELQRAAGQPPRTHAHPVEPTRPEPHAPARAEPDRGDAWEPPFDAFQELPRGYPGLSPSPRTSAEPEEEDPEESPPTDGRQLLGWAAKQDPDAKGAVMSFGKRNGFPSKIVTWDPEQVRKAYQHARSTPRSTGR